MVNWEWLKMWSLVNMWVVQQSAKSVRIPICKCEWLYAFHHASVFEKLRSGLFCCCCMPLWATEWSCCVRVECSSGVKWLLMISPALGRLCPPYQKLFSAQNWNIRFLTEWQTKEKEKRKWNKTGIRRTFKWTDAFSFAWLDWFYYHFSVLHDVLSHLEAPYRYFCQCSQILVGW